MKNAIILSDFKRFRAVLESPGLYFVYTRTTDEQIGVAVNTGENKWTYHDMGIKGFSPASLLDLWNLLGKIKTANE